MFLGLYFIFNEGNCDSKFFFCLLVPFVLDMPQAAFHSFELFLLVINNLVKFMYNVLLFIELVQVMLLLPLFNIHPALVFLERLMYGFFLVKFGQKFQELIEMKSLCKLLVLASPCINPLLHLPTPFLIYEQLALHLLCLITQVVYLFPIRLKQCTEIGIAQQQRVDTLHPHPSPKLKNPQQSSVRLILYLNQRHKHAGDLMSQLAHKLGGCLG
mmetsp:Transcript_3958/g.8751  ORF Transcript_3958/g.8751 Transcript_3958/m.8751 type:complete len:214 (+) Transcript_3958:291-932(+)